MRDITRARDECTPVEQRYPGRAIFGLFLGGFVSIRTQALPAGPPAASLFVEAAIGSAGSSAGVAQAITLTVSSASIAAGRSPGDF